MKTKSAAATATSTCPSIFVPSFCVLRDPPIVAGLIATWNEDSLSQLLCKLHVNTGPSSSWWDVSASDKCNFKLHYFYSCTKARSLESRPGDSHLELHGPGNFLRVETLRTDDQCDGKNLGFWKLLGAQPSESPHFYVKERSSFF